VSLVLCFSPNDSPHFLWAFQVVYRPAASSKWRQVPTCMAFSFCMTNGSFCARVHTCKKEGHKHGPRVSDLLQDKVSSGIDTQRHACGSPYNAVCISDHVTMVTAQWIEEELGWNGSGGINVLSLNLSRATEKYHDEPQDCRWTVRDSNLEPVICKCTALPLHQSAGWKASAGMAK
jgi:hypothetical protein